MMYTFMSWVSLITAQSCHWGELPNWDHLWWEEVLLPSDEVPPSQSLNFPTSWCTVQRVKWRSNLTFFYLVLVAIGGLCKTFLRKTLNNCQIFYLIPFYFFFESSVLGISVRTRPDTFSFTINGKTLKAKARCGRKGWRPVAGCGSFHFSPWEDGKVGRFWHQQLLDRLI